MPQKANHSQPFVRISFFTSNLHHQLTHTIEFSSSLFISFAVFFLFCFVFFSYCKSTQLKLCNLQNCFVFSHFDLNSYPTEICLFSFIFLYFVLNWR